MYVGEEVGVNPRLFSNSSLSQGFKLLFAFFKPRVLGAHGGAGYTFGALAIQVYCTVQ